MIVNEKEKKSIKNYNKYLVNEVEYEFYSSKTLEKIEASVCLPKEIIISYPISYTLSKFDKSTEGFNLNEYRNKFNIGKELYHKDKDIDTFDSNNSVYRDLCIPVEINGKDLVLEDRYEFLYPNNIALCEKNCSLFYTDYELERINCKCDYKEILDFKREMPDESDLLHDPNFFHPSQSGANGEIIKCLSKLPDKDSVVKNEAFYYCLVVSAGEIAMVFTAAFYGIKLVKNNIYNLGRNNKGINKTNKNEKINKYQNNNNNNDNNIITTSNRFLNNNNYNNPPKRNNIIINDDNENDNNEKEKEKKDEKPKFIMHKKTLINNNNNNISEENEMEIGKENEEPEIIKYKQIKDIKGKAEFIPPDYNFKFFKPTDNGVIKRIKRNEIPFKVKSTTKYLLELKENVKYNINYLKGPIYHNQNLLVIIEEEEDDKEKEKEKEEENGANKNILNKSINNNNQNIYISNNLEIKKEKRRIRNITSEKSFINIKTISPINKENEEDYYLDEEIKEKRKINESVSLFTLIKREQLLLRTPYKLYIEKDHSNLLAIILAEIMDKIYIIKICCFLKPYEMFSAHFFNYLLYHIMLLSLLCAFFTIKTIKKIFKEDDFPQLDYYLLYGLISSIIIWIIYKAFFILIDHREKVNDLINIRQELNKENNTEEKNIEKEGEINEDFYGKKFDELIRRIKIHLSIFFILGILITGFCFIYLVSFFAFYTGTKSLVFKAYYITLIEIGLIKFVYGLCLASLRKAGESNLVKNVYNASYYCNKYVS